MKITNISRNFTENYWIQYSCLCHIEIFIGKIFLRKLSQLYEITVISVSMVFLYFQKKKYLIKKNKVSNFFS